VAHNLIRIMRKTIKHDRISISDGFTGQLNVHENAGEIGRQGVYVEELGADGQAPFYYPHTHIFFGVQINFKVP